MNEKKQQELVLRYVPLKPDELNEEIDTKNILKEYVYNVNPISIIKAYVKYLAKNKDMQFDLSIAVINLIANYLIYKFLGKNRSLKGYLSSVFVEKLYSSFMDRNASKISSKINQIIKHQKN